MTRWHVIVAWFLTTTLFFALLFGVASLLQSM